MNQSELVSIIMVTYGQLQYTQQCIESILQNTSQAKTPFEIIVVDNASVDGTVQYLKGLESGGHIKAIYNQYNAGFPKANNQAAKISQGKYLLLLNNDTIVTAGWLEKLLRCIRSDHQLIAVGPYSNYSSGYQASPIPCNYKGNEQLVKFAQAYSQPEKYVNFLVFFCCLIKKSVWDELGGLDEDFGIGNFEDNLFCWRVVEKGYKMKIAGNCFIHHYGGASFGYKKDDPKKQAEYAKIMACNQKLFLKKINRYKSISLCMIVSDQERPEILKRCLDSISPSVDEICIVFNYKWLPRGWKKKLLEQQIPVITDFESFKLTKKGYEGVSLCAYMPPPKYLKFTDFSDMRNKSLDMATGNYILWLDVDDVMQTPIGLRDLILHNPDVDAFRTRIFSRTEIGTEETIFHSNLFKNNPKFRFRNRVHEDINISINEAEGTHATTNLTIRHLGYVSLKAWKKKNLRNYKLLLLDLQDNPSALAYYHIVNCLLIIGGYKSMVQAIKYIDECFEKFPLKKDDPLLPKMWSLRGVACMDAGQNLAAKQSLHKSYDEWQYPEAAVNLAKLYMDEKNWNKAIEVLNPIYELKEFKITNVPMDAVQTECLMLHHLGDCYSRKAIEEKNPELFLKAENYYREYLSIKPNLMVIDRLCKILRDTKRVDEANYFTIKAVNHFPGYFMGFVRLGAYEIQSNRLNTAKLFLKEALRLKPKYPDALHNLRMIEKWEGAKRYGTPIK